jgi:hypothetical protein
MPPDADAGAVRRYQEDTTSVPAGIDDGDYSNYLNNGSFDVGLSFWTIAANVSHVVDCQQRVNCARISPPSGGHTNDHYFHYLEQWVHISEPGTFEASVDVYGNSFHVTRLQVYDSNGVLKVDKRTVQHYPFWQSLSGSFAAVAGEYRVRLAVTWATISNQTSYYDNAVVLLNGEGPPVIPLLDSMTWSAWPECPVCSASNAVGWAGGPINTRSGNLSYQETDLVIPIKGESLAFRRAYASQAVNVYTTTLGHGWTHNYDIRLHFSDTALTGTVELQAPSATWRKCANRLNECR